MRTVVRTLIAVFLATAVPVLAAPAVRAQTQEAHQQSSGTNAAGSRQLNVSIDGVTPDFATSSSTITVRGTVTNDTGSPITGVQVQLLGSSTPIYTRSQMDSYSAGQDDALASSQEGTPVTLPGTLHSGKTAQWSVSFTAASAGYSTTAFDVYPLAAQAVNPDGAPAPIDRTFLPFWPGKAYATPLNVAWLWPLIDTPQQGACPATLATNSLAGSLGAGGRLGTLLTAGQQWAARDRLTWVADPALLSDAKVMTSPYQVGGSADCTDRNDKHASSAAASWLSTLQTATTTEPMILTPYADADVAALTQAGLDQNTQTAFALGKSTADKVLHRTGSDSIPIAWPADGTANAGVLTSLARDGGASTVVLNSGELQSSDGPQYDNALNATKTGTGAKMGVLLADSVITGVLGSASASSPAGTQFAAEQDFLAQTAMILAEGPNLQRSLVIAPPRRWDPSAAEATALLSLTNSAPWLRPTDLSALAAAASHLPAATRLTDTSKSAADPALGTDFTSQIAALDSNAAVFKDMLYKPGRDTLDSMDAAVTVTASAAWRGAGAAAGGLRLRMLNSYLSTNEQKVQIIVGKDEKILLGGTSGTTPVSVQNLLSVPVLVRVVATPSDGSELTAGTTNLVPVQPGKTATFGVPLHTSAITTTTLQLQLQTEDGSPLTWTSQSLNVQATRYGRALLVVIAAALGVLVLTSVARWVRRWLKDGRAGGERVNEDRASEDRVTEHRATKHGAEGRSGGAG